MIKNNQKYLQTMYNLSSNPQSTQYVIELFNLNTACQMKILHEHTTSINDHILRYIKELAPQFSVMRC